MKLNPKISKLIEERRSTIQEQTEDDDIIDNTQQSKISNGKH